MGKMQRFFKIVTGGYYTYLLALLLILFAMRPYNQGLTYLVVWEFFITLAFFSAIFNCNHHRKVRISAFILAFPTLFFSWFELFYPSGTIFTITICLAIVFMALCTVSTLFDVIRRAKVTLETLRGVVCAYFSNRLYLCLYLLLTGISFPGIFPSNHS